jgi:hypothetical protein
LKNVEIVVMKINIIVGPRFAAYSGLYGPVFKEI